MALIDMNECLLSICMNVFNPYTCLSEHRTLHMKSYNWILRARIGKKCLWHDVLSWIWTEKECWADEEAMNKLRTITATSSVDGSSTRWIDQCWGSSSDKCRNGTVVNNTGDRKGRRRRYFYHRVRTCRVARMSYVQQE